MGWASSTRLASLLVHCLLMGFWSSKGWFLGVSESLLRKRNWIEMVWSLPVEVRGFSEVELGTESFWVARWVIVVKGWISRIEDSVWWIWKCAKGEWHAQPSSRRRGSGRVRLLPSVCWDHRYGVSYQYQPLPRASRLLSSFPLNS